MKLSSALISGAMLAILGPATALQAQEVRYGVQIQWNIPMDDLKTFVDNRAGFGGGAHATIDFGGGNVLRPRLDYVVYPENANFLQPVFGAGATGKAKASHAALGIEYIYNFSGKADEGFYVSAGIGWHRWKADYDYVVKTGQVTVSNNATATSDRVGFSGGLGYNFNRNIGLEVRYLATKFEQGNGKQTVELTAGQVQVAALYRF